MKSRWLLVALLGVAMLVAGCSVTVGGVARRAPGSTPGSVGGQAIQRVLLGRSALSRIVKQPLTVDPQSPPLFGGPESLRGDTSAWPADCMGVAVMLQDGAYRTSNVRGVALETWRPEAKSAPVTRVKEGVVSLEKAADANALFDKISQEWRSCEGKVLNPSGGSFGLEVKISDVQVASSVLAATVSMGFNLASPLSESIPSGRALGVRDNCLIEVEVDFVNTFGPLSQGAGDVNSSALDIAQVMRDKVTALS
ncbi:sensor domain-containing protein [Mycobacterium scrofulaceum]|uniref:Sensor domain-containing protein n=1 Tax=Mycobacterium scrofulaceum TaxID=1783 RepID=A0A1X0KL67_MYCSC|nr:sensor domain-containing protein [Mycobacterium scrofulaceum]ORB76036.1 sensor domain-containing protein [Mycobacterium scrofulaceum]